MPSNSSVDAAGANGHGRGGWRWALRLLVPKPPPPPINPALAKHAQEHARSAQNRLADRITAFAGSMAFVYIHVVWFACWIGFGLETYPFGLLTMMVSLEAIFLSTFVLISQNRSDVKRQVVADEQWETVKREDLQNEELLDLLRQTLKAVKDASSAPSAGNDSDPSSSGRTDDPGPTR